MPLPSVTVNDRFSNQPGMLWSGVLAEIEAVRARANPNKARSFRDEQPCRKLVTKRLTRQFGERISPLLDAGTIKPASAGVCASRSEEHTSELQSLRHLVCRLLLEKQNQKTN